MVLFVFLCDGWKWVKTWKEGAQNCPEVPSDVTPDLTSTRTFIVKNEVQPVCWSIEPTVRCTLHACLLNSNSRCVRCTQWERQKGTTYTKSTAVCRTGTSSTKLQLFLVLNFVITKEWKDVCLLLVWHTYLVFENDGVVSKPKVAVLPTRLWNERRRSLSSASSATSPDESPSRTYIAFLWASGWWCYRRPEEYCFLHTHSSSCCSSHEKFKTTTYFRDHKIKLRSSRKKAKRWKLSCFLFWFGCVAACGSLPLWHSPSVRRTHLCYSSKGTRAPYIETASSIDQHTGWTSFLTTNVRVEVKSAVTSLGTSGQFWAPSFQVFTHFQPSQRKMDNTIVIRSQRTTR